MTECNSCPTKDQCDSKENCMIENNPHNKVKRVIAVMSGKGGVGKSTVTTLIAKSLNLKGYSVGILDSDLTGPSIPRLMKAKHEKVTGTDKGITPIKSKENISLMSLNFLMEEEESPAIWRGPMISATVKQFWTDVYWGELDYLIIDMPPGTSDVALTVMQSMPINGMIMVSTPHDMVSMIVAKSINMAKSMNIPIVGVIENMSYILCPDCNKEINIFKDNDLDDYLNRMDVELLGKLPMSQEIANMNNELFDKKVSDSMGDISNKIINFTRI